MSEFFELAFFSPGGSLSSRITNKIQAATSLNVGRNSDTACSLGLLQKRSIWFDTIESDGYTEYLIAVENLYITDSNLSEILNQICELVDLCFCLAPEIQFAIGIYELTGYYLRGTCSLNDVQEQLFPKAPLLFFRSIPEHKYSAVKYSNTLYYSLQQGSGIQRIF